MNRLNLLLIGLVTTDVIDDGGEMSRQGLGLIGHAEVVASFFRHLHDHVHVGQLTQDDIIFGIWRGRSYMAGAEPIAVDVDARLAGRVPHRIRSPSPPNLV